MLQLSSIIRSVGFMLLLTLPFSLIAQTYNLTSQSGTFTPIVSGTSVPSICVDFDYGTISSPLNIGFSFTFGENTFTQVQAGTDGMLSFVGIENIYIFPLSHDLSGLGGSAAYKTTGTAPNRVFTFEWLNWRWSFRATSATISFQVKLYETTNRIEFVYRQEAGAIDLRNTDYIITNASIGFYAGGELGFSVSDAGTNPTLINGYARTINTKPATGQIYRFNLVPKPEPTNSITNLSVTSNNDQIQMTWTDATGANLPTGYLILASTTNSFTTPVDGTMYTDDMISSVYIDQGVEIFEDWLNLIPGQDYYFRIYSYSNTNSMIDYKTDGTIPQTSVKFIRPAPANHVTNFTSFMSGGSLNLTWTDAIAPYIPNGYVIYASTTNSFPTPVDGTDIVTDNNLADGTGVVKVLNGVQAYNGWTNVDLSATYYFKIYPFTNSGSNIKYNTSSTVPTSMLKPQPTNHVTNFTASGNNGLLSNSWTDAIGTQLPDGYVIMASTSNSFTDPVDGTEITPDNNLNDNVGVIKVPYGTQAYSSWINYSSNTYYFKIFPYTNSGIAINYLTSPTVPQSNYKLSFKPAPQNHASGFTATNNNGVALNWVDGLNNALYFDGINDYIACGSQNFSTFTAEAWVCPAVVNVDQAIVSTLYEPSVSAGFELHISPTGHLCATLRNASVWLDIISPNIATAGDWMHVAVTFNGTTALLYENGVQVASGTASYVAGSSALNIGRRSSGLLYFNGKIDEVRMWNVVRTSTELNTAMNTELAGTETGLKSYYKFNQGLPSATNSGITTLTDAKATYNGTLNNFALTGTTSNWVNSYFAPDGYVIMANTTNTFTDPVNGVMASNDNDLSDNLGLAYIAQGVKSYSSWINSKGSSTYYFRIYPYTNTGGFIKYYTAATLPSSSLSFVKVVPQNHISNLTASATSNNIALNWTDSKEISPNSGNALNFDGTNDYVSLNDGMIDNSIVDAITIETWLYWSPTSASDVHFVCGKGLEQMEIHTSGDAGANGLRFIPTTGIYLDAYNVLPVNKWTHIAVVYDPANALAKMYINGTEVTLVKNGPGTMGAALQNTTNQFNIGRRQSMSLYYFKGNIEEFRIWNKVRTQAEITANIYNSLIPTSDGLLAYYKFNQGVASGSNASITTLTDATNNGNNCTLNNFGLTVTTSNWVGSFVAPDGYLIKASKTSFASIIDPVDGTDVTQDNDLADGIAAVKVAQGVQTYSNWANIESSTNYFFKVFPYTNSGTSIKFYKAATVPQVQVTSPFLQFSKILNTTFTNLFWGSNSWVDYNNDGYLDFLISGRYAYGDDRTLLYLNNKNGTFTLQSGIVFKGVIWSSHSWGDYDNDNDMDLIITGYCGSGSSSEIVTKIYKNNYPTNSFTEQTQIQTAKVMNGSASWGDFDHDGDLDILISGSSNKNSMQEGIDPISKIYRNNSDGTFTDMTEIDIEGIDYGTSSWYDFDNDGDLDIVLDGKMESNISTEIVYFNNGDNTFTRKNLDFYNLSSLNNGNSVSGDFNNDGLLDLLINGYNSYGHYGFSQYPYQNNILKNSSGSFNDLSLLYGTTTEGLNGIGTLVDYNNDGLLDVYLNGYDRNSNQQNIFFKNTGSYNFVQQPTLLPLIPYESISFGDYDNDGDLDILRTGTNDFFNGPNATELFKNNNPTPIPTPSTPQNLNASTTNKKTVFTWSKCTSGTNKALYAIRIGTASGTSNIVSAQALNSTGARLTTGYNLLLRDTVFSLDGLRPNTYYWSVQAVNQNGKASAFPTEKVYTIDSLQSNGLVSYSMSPSSLKLKWKPGNGEGRIIFVSKETTMSASPTNGVTYRAIPQLVDGCKYKLGENNWYCVFNGIADSVVITGLTPGVAYKCHIMEYYTLNNSDKYLKTIKPTDTNQGVFYTNDVTAQDFTLDNNHLKDWFDYDKDGFLDVITSGNSTNFYHNNGDNTFTLAKTISTGTSVCQKLVDFDNDGDLDLALSTNSNTSLYFNENNLNFSLLLTLENAEDFTEWGDFNNDGYLDILTHNDSKNTVILKNIGNSTFTELAAGLPISDKGHSIWGDYNNDGLLDILVTGYLSIEFFTQLDIANTALYKNNGDETFTEQLSPVNDIFSVNPNFYGCSNSSAAWGDYDNDGDLDLALMGEQEYGIAPNLFVEVRSKIYKNDYPKNTFTEMDINIQSMRYGVVKWGDFNNDGKLDLIISGGASVDDCETKIYINNGNDNFSLSQTLLRFNNSTVSLGDYDNDGDLDAIVSGDGSGSNISPISKIYRNNIISSLVSNSNTAPAVPTFLTSSTNLSIVNFNWASVKNDETPTTTLSYNIRYKNVDSTIWQGASHTPANMETRQILENGNCQLNTFKELQNLSDGTYEWQVQAVDQGFKSSQWSSSAQFKITNTLAEFTSNTVCWGDTTRFTDKSFSVLGIVEWEWTFEGNKTSAKQNPTFVFANSGEQTVTLTITDKSGYKNTYIGKVNVKHGVKAMFNVSSICSENTAFISNNSIQSSPTSNDYTWEWDFGDTKHSTNKLPISHQYDVDSTYKIKLRASYNDCFDTTSRDVIITDLPNATLSLEYGNQSFCKGDSVIYSVPLNPNYTYNWYHNNQIITEKSNVLKIKTQSGDYKVKVINNLSNTCKNISDVKTITVKDIPAQPVINPESEKTAFCKGDSVMLSAATQAGVTYHWYLNDGPLQTENNSFNAKEAGRYTLKTSFENGCYSVSSLPVNITVNALPQLPSISYGNTSICNGESITFAINSTNPSYTYKWQKNNVSIDGANAYSYTTGEAGEYSLLVESTDFCSVKTTPIAVVVKDMPVKPLIFAENNSTLFCPGSTSKLMVTDSIASYSYQWKRSGISIDGANQPSLKGKLSAGDYRIEAKNDDCAVESDILTLNTKPAPAKPNISARGPNVWILVCDNKAANIYKWYYNNQLVPTANTYQYVANKNLGDYKVEVNEGGECSTVSDIINIPTGNVVSGIDELVGEIVSISPNPSSGIFNVDLGMELMGSINVQILDSKGAIIMHQQFNSTSGFSINLTDYPVGMYLCKISHNGYFAVKKMVKE